MEKGVKRWAVNLSQWEPSKSRLQSCLALLPTSEWASVLRFTNLEDRKRALISRLMQRKLVHCTLDIDYENINIQRTPEGKPYLVNKVQDSCFPNFNFNVSHHGNFVVLVSDPACLVGVDVMAHDTRSKELPAEFFKPFASYFTDFEWETIHSAGQEADALFDQFYRFWCMKEAYIKAVGIGLGFDLRRAEFHYQAKSMWGHLAHLYIDGVYAEGWRFFLHKLGGNHWVCVARGSHSEVPPTSESGAQEVLHESPLNDTAFTILTIEKLLEDFGSRLNDNGVAM